MPRWVTSIALLAGLGTGVAVSLRRRRLRRERLARLAAKAAEDRHIGFRWLSWAGRLASERDAEAAFRAVAAALAARIGSGEARHLAAHLPLGLRKIWEDETEIVDRPQGFDRDELVARVQARLELAEATTAEELVRLVFWWLRHLAPEEVADVAGLLPHDLRELWETAQLIPPEWKGRLVVARGS